MDFGVKLCKLYEKTSAKGNRYLVGRLGGARVLILANDKDRDPDAGDYSLFVQPADPQQPQGQGNLRPQTNNGQQRLPQGHAWPVAQQGTASNNVEGGQ